MTTEILTLRKHLSRDLMDVIIRIGLILLLVVLCYRVVAPFFSLILWALILAVALYPAYQALAIRLGGRQGASAISATSRPPKKHSLPPSRVSRTRSCC